MAKKPKKVCEICGELNNLRNDYDCRTGKLRGILCRDCRVLIVCFDESVEEIERAIDYIENYDYRDTLEEIRTGKHV